MRKKVWLIRDSDGDYAICMNKPSNYDVDFLYYTLRPYALVKNLCKDMVKKWFGLKRQLKRSTCIQGYFDVSFTPIKRKGK